MICFYLACQVISHSFMLSFSSLKGLGKHWDLYQELTEDEAKLEEETCAMEEHLSKINNDKVMPIIDQWNLNELREWLTGLITDEAYYFQENCENGKIRDTICADPSKLSAEDILFLVQDEPRFKAHYQDFTALKGHNGTSKLAIKRNISRNKRHLELVSKGKWKIWKDTLSPLLTISLYSIFIMQSLHGMIYGPSFGTLVAFGISLSFFMVYGYIIYFTTTVEIMETYGEENPYFEEAPEETKDYVFNLIGSDWNIWSIRMLFIHQFITLVYLIFYRKWQELEKRRKAKEEEDFNRLFSYCKSGEKEKAKSIIQQYFPDIDINHLTNDGENALHVAVARNHTGIVKLLISNFDDKLDANVRNSSGQDAFDIAVMKKNIDIFDLLLGQSSPTITSLILAIKNDQVKMIQSLLSKIPSYKMVAASKGTVVWSRQ